MAVARHLDKIEDARASLAKGNLSAKNNSLTQALSKVDQVIGRAATIHIAKNTIGFGDLSPKELEDAREHGYEIIEQVGEGCTRPVYLAVYKSGEVEKLRVVKPEFTEAPTDNVTAQICRQKGRLNQAETKISNQLAHSLISEVVDTFTMGGRIANVERHIKGSDLESLVRQTGPIRPERFKPMAAQMLDANEYLDSKGMLHRDQKPSNFMVSSNGDVIMTDLQLAEERKNIWDSSVPTKGGTAYTDIDLLNALVGKGRAFATQNTEVTSLGLNWYYMLTGKELFPVKLEADPSEDFDPANPRLQLIKDGKKVGEISQAEYEKEIKNAIKNVPSQYRDLVYRMITRNQKKKLQSFSDVRKQLERTRSPFLSDIRDSIHTGIKFAIPSAAVAAIIGLAGWGMTGNLYNPEPRPSVRDMMSTVDYREFNLESQKNGDKPRRTAILYPYMVEEKNRLETLDEKAKQDIYWSARHGQDIHCVSQRVYSALLRAGYTHPELIEVYNQQNDVRIGPSFTHRKFMVENDSLHQNTPPEEEDAAVKNAYGVMELKTCFSPDCDISDIFATYFSTREDLSSAMIRAGSSHYFPYSKPMEGGTITIMPGYGRALPNYQQEMISSALAIYMMTKEDGTLDFNKMPSKEDYVRACEEINPGLPEKQNMGKLRYESIPPEQRTWSDMLVTNERL